MIIMIAIAAGRGRNRPEGVEDMTGAEVEAEVEAEAEEMAGAEARAGISGAMPTVIATVTTIKATSISITSSPPSMR